MEHLLQEGRKSTFLELIISLAKRAPPPEEWNMIDSWAMELCHCLLVPFAGSLEIKRLRCMDFGIKSGRRDEEQANARRLTRSTELAARIRR